MSNQGAPFRALLVVLACLTAGPAVAMATERDAVATIERLLSGLLDTDRRQATSTMAEREDAFAGLIDATHDLRYMARLSLGNRWEALSATQRDDYAAAFCRLSIRNYAARFRNTAGSSFTVGQARPAPGARMTVPALLTAPADDPVHLDYLLHETAQGWRIVNVVAEGVSELALQRSQFRTLFAEHGYPGLMREIDERLRSLETP